MSALTPPAEGLELLDPDYRSGTNALDTDFFQPCLARCVSYDRAVGYFTSHALAAWADAVPRLLTEPEARVRLIVGPILLPEDKAALRQLTDQTKREEYRQRKADTLVEEALHLLSGSDEARLYLFCWFVANGRIQIRIAFPVHIPDPEDYHEKFGIFYFNNSACVAFTGSANETAGGYRLNYEQVEVFRSWVSADLGRVERKVSQFNDTWEGVAPGLVIKHPSPSVLDRIRDLSQRHHPRKSDIKPDWRHQDRAIAAFMAHRRGILEMATGTGKTRTALRISARLLETRIIAGIVVSTSGNDLLDQWAREIKSSPVLQDLVLYRHYGNSHDIGRFTLHPSGSLLLCSRLALPELRRLLPDSSKSMLLAIHDEVHGFGSAMMQRELAGFHLNFAAVLGLSATPEREYNAEGGEFLQTEIGPVIFQYSLEDAIRDRILSPFRYLKVDYELTDNDRQRQHQVVARYEAAKAAGHPWPEDQLYRELALVSKTAEDKPRLFRDFVLASPEILNAAIVFVETHDFGEHFLETIARVTTAYSTYFDDDPPERLNELSSGDLDCLLCCKRLSQGIDIRHLRNVILVSADRGRLHTIQRIGRTLRTDPEDPGKIATVVDFVLRDAPSDHSDYERSEWLERLSRIRPPAMTEV